MQWISMQPEAQKCPRLQFWIHNRAQRMTGRKQVQIAINHKGINRDQLPTKDQLLKDKTKRDELGSNILCFAAQVKDSDAYWREECQNLIGSKRYFQDPPENTDRPARTPTGISLFQTRALAYNHHPAIHDLMPGAFVTSHGLKPRAAK